MRWSQTFIPTLREDPAGITHSGLAALLRGGYLRRADDLGYLYLPLFNRVRQKIFSGLDRVLARAGCLPIDLVVRDPEFAAGAGPGGYGERYQLICRVINRELRSYRQLPLSVYYTHHHPPEVFLRNATSSAIPVHEWLTTHLFAPTAESFAVLETRLPARIGDYLEQCGLPSTPAEMTDGIRGLCCLNEATAGPEMVFSCKTCKYAAVGSAAAGRPTAPRADEARQNLERVATPGAKTVEQVTAFLGITPDRLIKTLLYKSKGGVIAALVRGDRMVEEEKLRRAAGAANVELLAAAEVLALSGAPVGFSGPIGLSAVRIFADSEIPLMKNAVVGGNAPDVHLINVNHDDFVIHQVADIRQAQVGDGCPKCAAGALTGHTAAVLGGITHARPGDVPAMVFDDEQGREVAVVQGDFHLDLTEMLLTAAQIHHDTRGLNWPVPLTPYDVFVMAVNLDDRRQRDIVERLENDLLRAGIEVLYDDRQGRVGGRFKDADLLGIPLRVTVGPRGLSDDTLDLQWRSDGRIEKVGIPTAAGIVKQYVPNNL